jgi:transcription initiation factor TFIID subunit 2
MDLGTVGTNLDKGKYASMEAFASDIELIFRNCRQFNPPTTAPTQMADTVERVWKKEWAKANEPKLSAQEKRSLQALMNKLMKDEIL